MKMLLIKTWVRLSKQYLKEDLELQVTMFDKRNMLKLMV